MLSNRVYLIQKRLYVSPSSFRIAGSKKFSKKSNDESDFQQRYISESSKNSFIKSDEYQFLSTSLVHSLKFQQSLPRLPIPKLEDTCRRYLESQRAITNDPVMYNNTVKIVDDFMKNEGVRFRKSI